METTSFTRLPAVTFGMPDALEPVALNDPDARMSVAKRIRTSGFAVLQLSKQEEVTTDTPLDIAAALKLGPVFVPPLYRQGPVRASGSGTTILAADHTAGSTHAFHRTDGQRPHTDGTLQKLGEVRTTVIACASVGTAGGYSTFFNAVRALELLRVADSRAANMLMDNSCLERRATVNGHDGRTVGPAFAERNSRMETRFSLQPTDRFLYDAVEDPRALSRAESAFERMIASEDAELWLEFRLKPHQGLVFDNCALTHGRTPYEDSDQCRRVLHRGLFLKSVRP